MEKFFETLKKHIVEHPPNFGDGESVLTMLYEWPKVTAYSAPSSRSTRMTALGDETTWISSLSNSSSTQFQEMSF